MGDREMKLSEYFNPRNRDHLLAYYLIKYENNNRWPVWFLSELNYYSIEIDDLWESLIREKMVKEYIRYQLGADYYKEDI